MVIREWIAVHRKHHAKVETPEDPHSPQIHGIARVLFLGVFLYAKAAHDRETLDKYGHRTPEDWIERNLYSRFPKSGVAVMALAVILLFGALPALAIFAVQMIWIPFWAAGVVNGLGHYWGYRNFPVENASTNIVPWGILIGGEELHNNHHAYATSAKLSNRWFEFDSGWMYIRTLGNLVRWLRFYTWDVRAHRPIDLEPALKKDPLLQTVYSMRHDLSELWARSTASTDQLVAQLREWCRRAEASGIDPLRQFSRDLVRLS